MLYYICRWEIKLLTDTNYNHPHNLINKTGTPVSGFTKELKMKLMYGVNAVKSISKDEEGVWSFSYAGNGMLACMNEAYMEELGSGMSKRVVVSIPLFSSTKNMTFSDVDKAFQYINKFIIANDTTPRHSAN
jgi:hypothetical protein